MPYLSRLDAGWTASKHPVRLSRRTFLDRFRAGERGPLHANPAPSGVDHARLSRHPAAMLTNSAPSPLGSALIRDLATSGAIGEQLADFDGNSLGFIARCAPEAARAAQRCC